MRSAIDAVSDSIQDLEESGRWMLAEIERLRTALIPAEEWMAEDGCDCGTDEPGTCALCLTSKALRGAQPESHGPLLSVQDQLDRDLDDLEEL